MVGDIVSAMIEQGGAWLLCAVLLIACVTLYAGKSNAEQRERAQYERRVAEAREHLTALNQSSEAINAMRDSVNRRTETVNELTQGFVRVAQDVDRLDRKQTEQNDRQSRHFASIEAKIENLSLAGKA